MKPLTLASLALAGAVVAGSVAAIAQNAPATGPARVMYPKGFETNFVVYNDVDRIDRKRVRRMYVNKEALAKAEPNKPIPDGTILVMEDHEVELDASGNPVFDEKGRLKPTAKVTAVFVMEKRKGWGEAYPADKRNGDWDYAAFQPDGTVNGQARVDGCLSCHMSRKDRDFTFTFYKNVADGLPKSF